MSILNTHYLSPLRGRVAFGITTAVFSIYIYNNYDNLPSFREIKSRLYERYLKPECRDSEQQCNSITGQGTTSPDETPMAIPSDTTDNNKDNTK